MRWVAIGMLALTGCAWIKPTTEIRMNPMTRTLTVTNTKDVDITIDELYVDWRPDGGTVKVKKFVVSDKSSPVVTANVQQMLAFVEQQKAANEGLIGTVRELRMAVTSLATELGGIVGAVTEAVRGSQLNVNGVGSARIGTATQPE